MQTITYSQIRDSMDSPRYRMSLTGASIDAVIAAVNQGIDSHLEACFCPQRGDIYNQNFPMDIKPCPQFPKGASLTKRMDCMVSAESLPVLLRRLVESDDDEAVQLAGDILDTLEIKNDAGCYEIVSDEEARERKAS